jgi:hypothetical protein
MRAKKSFQMLAQENMKNEGTTTVNVRRWLRWFVAPKDVVL